MAWCNPALAGSTDWKRQSLTGLLSEDLIPLAGIACRP